MDVEIVAIVLPTRFQSLEERGVPLFEARALPLGEAQLLAPQHMLEHAAGTVAPAGGFLGLPAHFVETFHAGARCVGA